MIIGQGQPGGGSRPVLPATAGEIIETYSNTGDGINGSAWPALLAVSTSSVSDCNR